MSTYYWGGNGFQEHTRLHASAVPGGRRYLQITAQRANPFTHIRQPHAARFHLFRIEPAAIILDPHCELTLLSLQIYGSLGGVSMAHGVIQRFLSNEVEVIFSIRTECRHFPDTDVIILTSVVDENVINQCIRAGAIGYLLKDSRSAELCSAIHAAVDGQVQLSKQVALKLVAEAEIVDEVPSLTTREEDVLKLVAQGCSNKEICLSLNITEKTVKAHVGNIFRKIGVNSRTQATLYALRAGLVHLE